MVLKPFFSEEKPFFLGGNPFLVKNQTLVYFNYKITNAERLSKHLTHSNMKTLFLL